MRFYLGTHQPCWLERTDIPLFVSNRRLAGRRTLPRALGYWALDSGGFSELGLHGRWETAPERYAADAERYMHSIGNLEFAAVQDWMCEPPMLAKTGLTIADHQRLTVESYLRLRSLAPDVPWAPVVQGWRVGDYLGHVGQYRAAGVDLARLPVVGVGSVCRRQATREAGDIFLALSSLGIACHGFGFKILGLTRCAPLLASADSMAWSVDARRKPILLPGCVGHRNCANCLRYASTWYDRVARTCEESCRAGYRPVPPRRPGRRRRAAAVGQGTFFDVAEGERPS